MRGGQASVTPRYGALSSLISDVPDDVDNGDANSEYNLKRLPFTLKDCRAAGIR